MNHTEYSNIRLRDCIIKIEDAMKYATELGHSVIAFTDHDFVGSWVKIEKAKKNYPNLKVILGNEIYLCRNGLNASNFIKGQDKYYHFILLAKDAIGAEQIREISTRAWLRSYSSRGMRRVPTYYQDLFDTIGKNPGHVIGSTACLGGALATQILKGTNKDKLYNWLGQMKVLFGEENFYLEMQPNYNKEQILVNRELLTMSLSMGLNYIITTDSHYLKKEDREIHKAFLNAQDGDREVDDFYATTYMMGTEELEEYMKASFEDVDYIHAAYKSIEMIADMCEDYSIMKPLKIPSLKWKDTLSYYTDYPLWFKRIPALEKFLNSEYKSDRHLVNAVINGIHLHKDLQNQEAYDELNLNLEMTWESSLANKAQWSAYFLNLQNIIEQCWKAGTLVGPSRGSGGGFLLLYCLDIIQMNKLREPTPTYSWRFLNPARVSPLD